MRKLVIGMLAFVFAIAAMTSCTAMQHRKQGCRAHKVGNHR